MSTSPHAFNELIASINDKINTSPPTTAEAREAHAYYNKDITRNVASVLRHPYFSHVTVSGKQHEDFMVYWRQLEAIMSKIQEDDQYEASNWEDERKELTEIFTGIRNAHPSVGSWVDYNYSDSESSDVESYIHRSTAGRRSARSRRDTRSATYRDSGSNMTRGTPYIDYDSDTEFTQPWQRPGK